MAKATLLHRLRRSIRSRDSVYHPSNKSYKWFVLANMMLGTFMAVLDSTVVNVGLPKIMASFGVGLDKIEWVITAYMLSMAVMLPTSGWVADKFGFKRVYFLGLLFFTLGSLLCGLSDNENTLIFSRIVQGLGAGTIQPLGMAIITREFPLKQRGLALGFWSIAAAASVSFGPLIGGYLVDHFSWQLIFDINVPIGIIAMLFTVLVQKEYKNKNIKDFDFIGFISAIIFLPVLLYALSEGNAATNAYGWSAPYVLACFAISLTAFAVFIVHELTTEHPLVNLRLLKDHNFGLANLVLFIFSMGMFGSTFLMPLYLQNSLGYTAVQAGAVFLPVGIIQGLMSPVSGYLSSKINARIMMGAGIILLAFSFYLNSQLSFLSEHNFIMISLYMRGLGMGLIFTPMSTLSLVSIPKEKMAQASAISNTLRQMSGSIGVAFFTTLLTSRVSFHSQVYGQSIVRNSQELKNVTTNLAYYIQSHGGGNMTSALKQGQNILFSGISKQAFIHGINDDFLIAGLITIVVLVPTMLLRTRSKKESHSTI